MIDLFFVVSIIRLYLAQISKHFNFFLPSICMTLKAALLNSINIDVVKEEELFFHVKKYDQYKKNNQNPLNGGLSCDFREKKKDDKYPTCLSTSI